MITCIRGHARCVSALLDAGANANIADSFVFSPLSWAAMTGSEACLRVLLNAGADVNKVIDNTGISLIAAATSWMRKYFLALIHVEAIVSRQGNHGDYASCTCTTVNSNQDTLDVLIHAGSDVNVISCVCLTPLSLAVIGGSNICTKQLLNTGADVNTFNCDHVTPLMFAAIHNYPDCLRVLLHNKADVNVLDADDKSAVAHAREYGHTECLELLMKAGASVNTCDKKMFTPLI